MSKWLLDDEGQRQIGPCECCPPADGHVFGIREDLLCRTCLRPWEDNRRDPQPCPVPMERGRGKR